MNAGPLYCGQFFIELQTQLISVSVRCEYYFHTRTFGCELFALRWSQRIYSTYARHPYTENWLPDKTIYIGKGSEMKNSWPPWIILHGPAGLAMFVYCNTTSYSCNMGFYLKISQSYEISQSAVNSEWDLGVLRSPFSQVL